MLPDIKTIEEILSVDYSRTGPLKHVENVPIPEPIARLGRKSIPRMKGKRGPKSDKEWVNEMRKVWRYIDDEEKLDRSWLTYLPQVQNLAGSSYGGRSVGRGRALQTLLRKAVIEAQKYTTDKKILEVLSKYPRVKMKELASQFGLKSREHFSRNYARKATILVVRAFQLLLAR
jgi:hypothetical protein